MSSPSKQRMTEGVPKHSSSGRVKRRMSNFLKSADLESIDPLCLPDPPSPANKSQPISSLPARTEFLRDVTNTPTTSASSPIPKQKRKRRLTIETINSLESTATTSNDTTNTLPWLLRKYCSLPPEQRGTSSCVHQIYHLSGGYKLLSDYSLRQQVNHTLPTSNSEEEVLLQQNKRQILTSMIPAMETLEQQRHMETQYIQSMTQCRSEKIRRKGGIHEYIYFDISTQQQVHPLEYTQRYLKAIQIAKSQKPQFYNEHEKHLSNPQELGTSSTLSTIESNTNDEPTTHLLPVVEFPLSPRDAPHNAIYRPLSLPAREDLSSNPHVALAQQRLWKAIDDALHDYSTEVMRIRNLSKTNNTTTTTTK